MAARGCAFAEIVAMCREYVSLQIVSVPTSIIVTTNGMFLPANVKAGQYRAGQR